MDECNVSAGAEAHSAQSRNPRELRPSPPHLDFHDGEAVLNGPQRFVLTRNSVRALPEDALLGRRQALVAAYLLPLHLRQRTVLDLAPKSGFFSFLALLNGADKVVALGGGGNDDASALIEKAQDQVGLNNLEVVEADVNSWDRPADVVIAFDVIHHIYDAAPEGGLDGAVRSLAQLANYLLLVEWTAPEDSDLTPLPAAAASAAAADRASYTCEAFEAALDQYFARHEVVGAVCATRKIYAAFHTVGEVDLSCPLPLVRPAHTIISCHLIAEHGGTQYWSRVYDGGDVIIKQAALDLAEREASFLSRLHGPYFPRVLEAGSEDNYSVVVLEKVHGLPLEKMKPALRADPDRLRCFFLDCLCLLGAMRAETIVHRDIKRHNLLVRDEKPVLIDFGWAISATQPYFTPRELGIRGGRLPNGDFCDVYSMGKIFEWLNGRRYSAFQQAIELMTETNASLRLTDLETLATVFQSLEMDEDTRSTQSPVAPTAKPVEDGKTDGSYPQTVRLLLEHVSRRNARLKRMADEAWRDQIQRVSQDLGPLISPGAPFILVDEDHFRAELTISNRALPFLERYGAYWGPPPDDETAIREMDRLRQEGARFMVFGWTTFWWLDHYAGLHRYLRSRFPCVLENERLVVFDLREEHQ